MYQNMWNTTKAVIRRKPTALSAYIRKGKKSKFTNLRFNFLELEKVKQSKPKGRK